MNKFKKCQADAYKHCRSNCASGNGRMKKAAFTLIELLVTTAQ